jgi:peptide/nickel transport system permease protein
MFKIIWHRLIENKLATIGGIIVGILFIVAIFAPFIAPNAPDEMDRLAILTPPSFIHLLGTDDLGRDVLSRMIYGARVSLFVGFAAVGISIIIGIIIGALSGYFGGIIDSIFMRFVDIMLSIPTFFLILAVITFLEPGIYNIMIVIGLTSWMGVARLVRAEFLSCRDKEFILAVRAVGASGFRIMFRHMLPNSLSPIIVSAVLGVASAVLVESALSFLGIGVQSPTPSWGNILTSGKDNIEIAWWLSFFPGSAILITVLGYNLLGEGLRDSLDPRVN